jgi:arylsulfatase A-like enzyme
MLEMAGLKGNAEHNKQVDGLSIVPLLRQTGEIQRDALYWHYPHYWRGGQSRPFGAVRNGDWKLIEYYEDMRAELYNLKDDIGESKDLAAANPQKAAELRGMLHAWRQRMDAQMPTPKPVTTRPTTQPAGTEPVSEEEVWD